MKIDNESVIEEVTREISLSMLGFDVWAGIGDRIVVFRKAVGYELGGSWTLIMPILGIGLLIVTSTMLGAVYERTKEVHIFSSLGLSPRAVSLMFLAEACVYAVISCLVGHSGGIATINLLFDLGLFPPDFYPNYTVSFMIIILGLLMMTTLLSTLYPALKASSIVTPSLERKWKVASKPIGSEWSIGLPFAASSHEESAGVLLYFEEFFRGHMLESTESFVTKSVNFYP